MTKKTWTRLSRKLTWQALFMFLNEAAKSEVRLILILIPNLIIFFFFSLYLLTFSFHIRFTCSSHFSLKKDDEYAFSSVKWILERKEKQNTPAIISHSLIFIHSSASHLHLSILFIHSLVKSNINKMKAHMVWMVKFNPLK